MLDSKHFNASILSHKYGCNILATQSTKQICPCVVSQATELYTDCPKNFVNLNGSCYQYHKEEKNFIDANETCKLNGGYLIEIESKAEQIIIWNYLSLNYNIEDNWNNRPYIGLSNIKSAGMGHYRWISGKLISNFEYWNESCPHTEEEGMLYCVTLGGNHGEWVDIPCDATKPFICESKAKLSSGFNSNTDSMNDNMTHKMLAFYISMPFIILCIGACVCAPCLKKRRNDLKDIRLKLPKVSIPFDLRSKVGVINSGFSGGFSKYDDSEEIQFNCFGPDESEHEHESTPLGSSKKVSV